MAEGLADYRQAVAGGHGHTREAMTKVMNSQLLNARRLARSFVGLADLGEVTRSATARENVSHFFPAGTRRASKS